MEKIDIAKKLAQSPEFTVSLQVRDYECDMQGIVNNAVYLNYLEHARHEALNHLGLNFKTLIDQQINFVAIRIEIDYKKMLKSSDHFTVLTTFSKTSKLKYLCSQTI